METQLNFSLKLSLEEMALRRFIINLWTESYMEKAYIKAETNEKCVKSKVSTLPLPESVKKRMMHLVRPVGYQIKKGEDLIRGYISGIGEDIYLHAYLLLLKQLCWTCAGIIDYQKTAENILNTIVVHRDGRSYDFACEYCLEDYIPVLWEVLPEEYIRSHFENNNMNLNMESYWHCVMKGEESKLDQILRESENFASFHEYAFRKSSANGNKSATKYFYQKLAKEERDNILISSVCNIIENQNDYSFLRDYSWNKYNTSDTFDALGYLLSLMTPEQQMQIFKKHAVKILKLFLNWSLHDFLLDGIDVIWTFLPETTYHSVADLIFQEMRIFYLPNIIQTFLSRSPKGFRRIFVSYISCIFLFNDVEDSETLKVVLKHIDPETRAELVSSDWFLQLLEGFMRRDKWDSVELCLQETHLSKEDKKILRKKIISLYYPELPPPSLFNPYLFRSPPLFRTLYNLQTYPTPFTTPLDSHDLPASSSTLRDSHSPTNPSPTFLDSYFLSAPSPTLLDSHSFPTPYDSLALHSPFLNPHFSQCPFPRYLTPDGSRNEAHGWNRSCRLKRCFDILDDCVVGPVLNTLATEIPYIEFILNAKCTDLAQLRLCESYLEQQKQSQQVVELKQRVTKWKDEIAQKRIESCKSSTSMLSSDGPRTREENSKPLNPTLEEMKETLEAFRDLKSLLQEFPSLLEATQLSRKAKTKEEKTKIILNTLLGNN